MRCHVCSQHNCKRKVCVYGDLNCEGEFTSLHPDHTAPKFKSMDIVMLKGGSAVVICTVSDRREGGHEVAYSVEYIKGLENQRDGTIVAWHKQSELTFLDSFSGIVARAMKR